MEKETGNINEERIQALIDSVTADLKHAGLLKGAVQNPGDTISPSKKSEITSQSGMPNLSIDLADPSLEENRHKSGILNPQVPDGLAALIQSTGARIGVGRAGARTRTASWLLFQSDHAVTQDALYREVDQRLLDELGLFSVQTCITGGKEEYLLRPDLGRRLCKDAENMILSRCAMKPNIQICAGDGLSAAAIEANLEKIMPVMNNGFKSAGLSAGTPFFIRFCRVGVMNHIGDLLQPDVLILLIGERPGLGRADSMSAYMAFRSKSGQSDADRDVICNIYDAGGTNPLEAGAYVVQLAKKMLDKQASGIQLRIADSNKEK